MKVIQSVNKSVKKERVTEISQNYVNSSCVRSVEEKSASIENPNLSRSELLSMNM